MGSNRQHVIELNGQQYNALTGKPVTHVAQKATAAKPQAHKAPVAGVAKHLDGFTRRASPQALAAPTHKVHTQPEKSKTLMRAGVKKPVSAKIHAKAHASSPVAAKPTAHRKPLVESVKPGRAIRATHAAQSSLISKFGRGDSGVKTAVLPVAPEPGTATPSHKTHAPAIINHPAQKAIPTTDPFQAALEQAVSHEQPRLKKARLHHRVARKLHVSPRLVNTAAFSIVAFAITGIIAYQNLPELAMRVAATRAGFHATLPAYQPSGFTLDGPIKYEPGEVTLNYGSATDERAFQVVQRNSSWNSETLLENFVSSERKAYQTFQANGRTIYIYDGNKATWVDGGVWYSIDGKANLNSDQLLRIAGSL